MKQAMVSLVRGLGQLLNAYYADYDRETSDLLRDIAAWLDKHDKAR